MPPQDSDSKSRERVFHSSSAASGVRVYGTDSPNKPMLNRISGGQTTVGGNHVEWALRNRILRDLIKDTKNDNSRAIKILRGLDIGGTFYSQAQVYTDHNCQPRLMRSTRDPDIVYYGNGYLFPWSNQVNKSSSVWQTASSGITTEHQLLWAAGGTAISRTAPTRPSFSLATALGELLSDGLPAVVGNSLRKADTFRKKAKAAGDEYLNVEFGWRPFLSDIQKLCHTVQESKRLLDKYEKESGRIIGRNYSFPDVRETKVEVLGTANSPTPGYPSPIFSTYQGTLTKTTEITRKTWFQGSYSYAFPPVEDSRGVIMDAAEKANHLLGLKITPEVLWNLAPWSWLADWFVNVGSLATNVTALGQDELMIHRAYCMRTLSTKCTYELSGISTFSQGALGPLVQTFETTTKLRVKASPYGFGLTFEDFSPKQMAILAALGLTRSRAK